MPRSFLACTIAGALLAACLATTPPALSQSTGLPPEVASAGVTVAQWNSVRAEVRRRASQARVSERALLAAAEATGARFASSGQFNALSLQSAVIEALEKQAEQLGELEARLQRLTGDADPEVARLFTQARAALDAGRLREADRLLADVASRDLAGLQRADAEAERLRMGAAQTIGARGEVAFVQADYRISAGHFARAEATAPQSARKVRFDFLSQQADALRTLGERFEIAALLEARAIYETRMLPLAPRAAAPEDFAIAQNDLSIVLRSLGERQDGEEAMRTFAAARTALSAALSMWTRDRNPTEWAAAQGNLSSVLGRIGERQAGAQAITTLNAARDAARASLLAQNRSTDPGRWAMAQLNLGNVLRALGERQGGPEVFQTLSEARAAYAAGLAALAVDTSPNEWSATQNNLGVVLNRLGEMTEGARGLAYLNEARTALEAALRVRTRDADALGWAETQMNLGATLLTAGARQRGAQGLSLLTAARGAYEAALNVQTRASDPTRWATTQNNLCFALWSLGKAQDNVTQARATLTAGRTACEAALLVRTRSADPRGWARTQMNLGILLMEVAALDQGPEGGRALTAARAAYEAALTVVTRDFDAVTWAQVQVNFGVLERATGDRGGGRAAYLRAAARYRAALEVFTEGHFRAIVLNNLANVEQLASEAQR